MLRRMSNTKRIMSKMKNKAKVEMMHKIIIVEVGLAIEDNKGEMVFVVLGN